MNKTAEVVLGVALKAGGKAEQGDGDKVEQEVAPMATANMTKRGQVRGETN